MFKRLGHGEKPFDERPALQHLTYVMHSVGGEKYGMLPTFFATLLRVPLVRRLHCENMGSEDIEDSTYDELREQESRSSAVTRLELLNSALHRADMDHVLRIPKALDTFISDVGVGHQTYAPLDFAAMRTALDAYRESLETLWLGNQRCAYEEWMEDEDIAPLTGFASFPKLKRMGMNPIFLFGFNDAENGGDQDQDEGREREDFVEDSRPDWDESTHRRLRGFLPPNLKVFTISFIQFRGAHLLKALIDLMPARPASLKVIRLEGAVRESESLWAGLAELARLARAEGVDLSIIDGPPPYIFPRYDGSWEDVEREMWSARGDVEGQDSTVYRGVSGEPTPSVTLEELEEWIRLDANPPRAG